MRIRAKFHEVKGSLSSMSLCCWLVKAMSNNSLDNCQGRIRLLFEDLQDDPACRPAGLTETSPS